MAGEKMKLMLLLPGYIPGLQVVLLLGYIQML
jgi:thioredoxin-related protein